MSSFNIQVRLVAVDLSLLLSSAVISHVCFKTIRVGGRCTGFISEMQGPKSVCVKAFSHFPRPRTDVGMGF